MYSKHRQLEIINIGDYNENSLLHLATNNPESLRILHELIPENERLAIISNTKIQGPMVPEQQA